MEKNAIQKMYKQYFQMIEYMSKKKSQKNIIRIVIDNDDESSQEEKKENIKERKDKVEAIIKHISNDETTTKLFEYEGENILVILDNDNKAWYKGKDICDILEYAKSQSAISAHVSEKYKKPFSEFKRTMNISLKMDNKTIFISDPGIFQLISRSKKDGAIVLWEFITETILPELFTKGTYSLPVKKSDIERLMKNFYDDNMLSDYKDKLAIYLAYIGEYLGKHILKFGKSNDFVRRDLKEHRKMYKQFNVIKIWETISNDLVEESIKYNFLSKNMLITLTNKELKINCPEKTKRELVRLDEINDLDYCLNMIDNVVKNKVIPQEQDYKNKIKEIETEKELIELRCENKHLKTTIERLEKMNGQLEKMTDQLHSTIENTKTKK
jgi:prophage antirepressor-like protein